jgi:hypothetical protein
MTTAFQSPIREAEAVSSQGFSLRGLYHALLTHEPSDEALDESRAFLGAGLQQVAGMTCDLPDDPHALYDWMDRRHEVIGDQYAAYLAARKAGAPRQYFSSRAHALYFLRGVAPTKLVDGSWLYGLVHHWQDDRFHGLIRTYLEELGEGRPQDNHVVMYRQLLASQGCEHLHDLDDELYHQGALQLSLAHNAPHFLPEIIGFNLGYEQLPLHLLITSYELNELGIDPYYFTVHVTVDNAGTGHARKAIDSVLGALPTTGDRDAFYRRLRTGYLLNELGKGTVAVIGSFDLEQELGRILKKKSLHGRHAHSDYCRVEGRTVNEWLSDDRQIPEFLRKLEGRGWIRRHADPAQSRFWSLVHGSRAEMFGVFSPYELQVLHDWIAGERVAEFPVVAEPGAATPRRALPSFRATQRLRARRTRTGPAAVPPSVQAPEPNDFDEELRLLEQNVARAPSQEHAMALLADMIGPATHHTPAGLMATRLFTDMLYTG